MVVRAAAVLLIAALAGCGGEILTSPDALSIEPFRVKALRAPQSVAFNNGLTSPVKHQIEVRGGMGMFVPAPTVVASARLTLLADFGDGTATRVDGEGGSAFGMQDAFEGAIQNALHRLLIDPAFLAYMNR